MGSGQGRLRVRLRFIPRWQGVIEGFAVNFCRTNEWRVRPDMDFADLYQEAWILFDKCKQLYPLVTQPQHFTALYKTALYRFVTTLASNRTRRQEIAAGKLHGDPTDLSEVLIAPIDSVLTEAEVRMMLEDAPAVVKRIWLQFGDGAQIPQRYKRRGKIRETSKTFLSRIAGVDPYNCNVVQDILQWVLGDKESWTRSLNPRVS